jgi:hypothetical protein
VTETLIADATYVLGLAAGAFALSALVCIMIDLARRVAGLLVRRWRRASGQSPAQSPSRGSISRPSTSAERVRRV